MDETDPSITFDREGISNHYWDFQNNVKHKLVSGHEGKKIIEKKVESIKNKSKGKEFDCILGLSGGLDSSYMLHKVVTEYNLKPLVFHVDGGWNTDIAVHNISQLVNKLGVELFTEVINWEEMRDFQLAMFRSGVPHLDVPQDMAFVGVLYKFANKYGIKTILNGGNIATESVQRPLDLIYYGADLKQAKDILKKFSTNKMTNYPFTSIFYHKIWLKYFKKIQVFKPLNLLDYSKTKAIKELEKEYDWKPYSQKHFESRFTKFFEGYWLLKRFNFDMRRVELSSMILTNQISRDQALNILKTPPLLELEIKNEFNYIANKLNISTEILEEFLHLPKKFYWDYANNSSLLFLGERILNFFGDARRGGSY